MPIKELTDFPHEGVYTQILASNVNVGKAGVFALFTIEKDFDPFPEEGKTLFYVSEKKLKALKVPRRVYELYDRLGALEGDKRYTYVNFARLEQSAFIADGGEKSNLRYGDDDRFYTTRKIKAGEELTVDYDSIG